MDHPVLLLGRLWGCQRLENPALEGLALGYLVPEETVQC